MVTGATGYVAGWIIKLLLDAGMTVHAAVRDPSDAKKRFHLDTLASQSPGTIHYFKADLLDEGSFAEVMQDCSHVFHTASPFSVNVSDPLKDLLEPAKLGTRNVLNQASQTHSVKRVILTSSCAAIYGDNKDLLDTPNGIFTEDVWNTSSSLAHNPYSFSKTEAEREAWRLVKAQNQWDLVVINPSLVMGPGTSPKATSESFNIMKQLCNGTMRMGVPDWGMGVVDVRDVAQAHLFAAFLPKASGRYIVSGHNTTFLEMASTLYSRYGEKYALPRRTIPKFLIWLIGPLLNPGMTRRVIANNVGYSWKADNSKSKRELGMYYRPLQETMIDFFEQLKEAGEI